MLTSAFARPELLPLALAAPAALVLGWWGGRRRRAALAVLGDPLALGTLVSPRPGRRAAAAVVLASAVLGLAAAAARPRWGGGGDPGAVVGRDIVVVLDLSKSMLAADIDDPDAPTRWQAAKAGVADLIDAARRRGGHRIGLVLFAGKPALVCPLTADCDHVADRLAEFSPTAPPPEVFPDKGERFVSGTRIGAAIAEAVAAHDPRFPGSQDIILVSDGDDPGPDADREPEVGLRPARAARIPVHVVGVGDPDATRRAQLTLGSGDDVELVETAMEEGRLKEIARGGRGEFAAVRRGVPRIGEFFRTVIEPKPSRELADDVLPQPRDRTAWFAAAGLALLAFAFGLEGRS